jgi:hypothetical protein
VVRPGILVRANHVKHAPPQARQLEEQQQQQQQMADHVSRHKLTHADSEVADVRSNVRSMKPFLGSWADHAGVQISLGLAVALLALSFTTEPAAAAAADGMQHQHSIQPIMDLAEGEEFWGNVARYSRYFVTVMLGTGYVMVQPLLAAFKRPVTAILAVVGLGGGFLALRFVLNAMLGVQEPFAYEPGSIVPYN